MAARYTPFLTKAAGTITQGLERRDVRWQKERQNKLAGSAYMGDPQAMEELMQVNPAMGIQLEQQVQKKTEREQQNRLAQQAGFKEDFSELSKEIATYSDYESSKEYAEEQMEGLKAKYPILSQPDTQVNNYTEEIFNRIKQFEAKDGEKTSDIKLQDEVARLQALEQTPETKNRIKQLEDIITKKGTITGTMPDDPSALTRSQAGKLTLGGIEGETSVAQNIAEIDNLIKTVSSPDYIGGVTGIAVQGLNSAVSQIQQLFGGENLLNEDGSINEKAMDLSGDTISRLQKAAGQGGLASSQALQIAYILARANDPTGRLSDRDVKVAEEILGDTADPKARAKILRDVQRRLISNYNIQQSTIAKSQKKPFKRLTLEGLRKLSGVVSLDKDTPTSRIMKNVGFPE
jgi:hypothetical protein